MLPNFHLMINLILYMLKNMKEYVHQSDKSNKNACNFIYYRRLIS